MPLREDLLAERENLRRQLDAVETLLRLRFGWSAGEDSHRFVMRVADEANARQIAYAREVRVWLDSIPPHIHLTVNDFRSHLINRYGEAAVNDNSIRSPFAALEAEGLIEIVQPGAGRNPTVYRRTRKKPSDAS